jgi:hypothetical protein
LTLKGQWKNETGPYAKLQLHTFGWAVAKAVAEPLLTPDNAPDLE